MAEEATKAAPMESGEAGRVDTELSQDGRFSILY